MLNKLAQQPITNWAIPTLVGQDPRVYLAKFIQTMVGLGFVAGAVVFFFMFLTGAISWMTAGADKGAVELARRRISNAFIGFVILMSMFAIMNGIGCIFKINFLSITIGPFHIGFDSNPICKW